jgi:hypothetical protein
MTIIPPDDEPRTLEPVLPGDGRVRRRRRVPLRFWVIGVLVAMLLVITATGGIRSWWAHRLHDITSGGHTGDFLIGVAIGVLPLVGVIVGSLGARGARRVLRMFAFGAAGFCVTYLLSPSPVSSLAGHGTTHVFDREAPGYLAGVVTGEGAWLVALALAWWRLRRWRRGRAANRPRGPA